MPSNDLLVLFFGPNRVQYSLYIHEHRFSRFRPFMTSFSSSRMRLHGWRVRLSSTSAITHSQLKLILSLNVVDCFRAP